MKKFLRFVFDVDQKHLPSPAQILNEKWAASCEKGPDDMTRDFE